MALRINTNQSAVTQQLVQQVTPRIQGTVNVATTVGDAALEELMLLKLVERACTLREAARAKAKLGENSAQAIAAGKRIVRLEQTAVAINASIERYQAPTAEAAPDVYQYRGRITDTDGTGVAGRVVQAQAPDGSTLIATKTDEQGNFTLTVQAQAEAPTAAQQAAAADPANSAPAIVQQSDVDAGTVEFTVSVADASGGTPVSEGLARVVETGQTDVGQLVLQQQATAAIEYDPTARYTLRLLG